MVVWWMVILFVIGAMFLGLVMGCACAMSGRVSDVEDYRAAYKAERMNE